MMPIKAFVLVLLLTSCTNQNVVEVSVQHQTASYPTETASPVMDNAPVDETNLLNILRQRFINKTKVQVSPPIQGCEKRFKLPELVETPELPKRIMNNEKLNRDELDEILSIHIVELRKTILENKRRINKAYADYQASCKK